MRIRRRKRASARRSTQFTKGRRARWGILEDLRTRDESSDAQDTGVRERGRQTVDCDAVTDSALEIGGHGS
jgi:hypothetical protein